MRRHTALDILLVGKHQQKRILHFTIVDDFVKLGTGLLHSSSVTRIDNENQTLGSYMQSVNARPSCLSLHTVIPE